MAQDIIKQLGGNRAVADALGTTPGAVANWRLPNRSIPWRYRPALAKLAAERAVSLPDGFWDTSPASAAA